jgi:hypothetical protein
LSYFVRSIVPRLAAACGLGLPLLLLLLRLLLLLMLLLLLRQIQRVLSAGPWGFGSRQRVQAFDDQKFAAPVGPVQSMACEGWNRDCSLECNCGLDSLVAVSGTGVDQ